MTMDATAIPPTQTPAPSEAAPNTTGRATRSSADVGAGPQAPTSRPGFDGHLVVVLSILATTAAIIVALARAFDLSPEMAAIGGAGFAVLALVVHLWVSSAGRSATATAHLATADAAVAVRRERRPAPELPSARPASPLETRLAIPDPHRLPRPAQAEAAKPDVHAATRNGPVRSEPDWADELARRLPEGMDPLPRPDTGVSSAPSAHAAAPPAPTSASTPSRGDTAATTSTIDETEVERVERLVKQLVDNVRLLEATNAATRSAHIGGALDTAARQSSNQSANAMAVHEPSAAFNPSPPPLPAMEAPTATPPPLPNDAAMQIAASITALKSAQASQAGLGPDAYGAAGSISGSMSGSMSGALPLPTANSASISASILAPHAASDQPSGAGTQQDAPARTRTDVAAFGHDWTGQEVLSALNAQRFDVYLEPILDLAEQRPQHYEVSIALHTVDGSAIDLAHVERHFGGTGLLPLIDQTRIVQAATLAERLAARGKSGSVLTDLAGETLADAGFQGAFAAGDRRVGSFPGHLVLTLPQSHVRVFTNADWQTLHRLRAAGFAFALSDVTSLDMDFAALAQRGFVMARLDASVFLIGLPAETSIVPPADICRHLSSSGLSLIVGGIVDDHQLARIFGFGVLFGQGQVFGGPRALRSTVAPAATSTPNAPAYAAAVH
jgi:cyclic-di-GMP phosphodiesterase TipF (flagellum assembly factor)